MVYWEVDRPSKLRWWAGSGGVMYSIRSLLNWVCSVSSTYYLRWRGGDWVESLPWHFIRVKICSKFKMEHLIIDFWPVIYWKYSILDNQANQMKDLLLPMLTSVHIKKSRPTPTQFCQAGLLLFWPLGWVKGAMWIVVLPTHPRVNCLISIKWTFNAWKHHQKYVIF